MIKKKFGKVFLSLISVLFLVSIVSCGGGGSSSDSTSTAVNPDKEGVFVDSPVIGIPYQVIYNGNVIFDNVTTDNGTFYYKENASVKFYLDQAQNYALGEIKNPKPVITPQSFFGDDNLSSVSEGFILSTLLQQLDKDNETSNGIQIDDNKSNGILSKLTKDEEIVKQVDTVKSNVEDKLLNDAVNHFASYNLYGRYNTDNTTGRAILLPNESIPFSAVDSTNIVTCYNSDGSIDDEIKVVIDAYFFANKGYGVFQSIFNDNSTEYEFITFEPQSYIYDNVKNEVTITLKGVDEFGADYDIAVNFSPYNPDNVTLEIVDPEDQCEGKIELYRVIKPEGSDCVDMSGNYTFDNNSSIDVVNCDISEDDSHSGFIYDNTTCKYDDPLSNENGSLIIEQEQTKCELNMTFGDGDTGKGYIIPGTKSFYFYLKDNIQNETGTGISPNLFLCDYDNATITCNNVYIDVEGTVIKNFAYENLIFNKSN